MASETLILIITEGLVFGLVSIALLLSFQWLKFPDLTPDGSFVLGACLFAKALTIGYSVWLSFGLAFLIGALSGILTAFLYRKVKIQPVLCGLISATALFSVGWKILGKPNQFVESDSLYPFQSILSSPQMLLCEVVFTIIVAIICIHLFAESVWGFKTKAIGSNPLLGKSITKHESAYYFWGLGLSNGLCAVAGCFYVHRSYSADVNMGSGQTLSGLVSLIIGLSLAGLSRTPWKVMVLIVIASICYRAILFYCLTLGLPAELFKLFTSAVLVVLFFVVRSANANLFRDLRWK